MEHRQKRYKESIHQKYKLKLAVIGTFALASITACTIIPQLPNSAQPDQQTSQDFRQQLEDPNGKQVPGDFAHITPLPITPVNPNTYTPEPHVELTPHLTPIDMPRQKIGTPVAQQTPLAKGPTIYESSNKDKNPTPDVTPDESGNNKDLLVQTAKEYMALYQKYAAEKKLSDEELKEYLATSRAIGQLFYHYINMFFPGNTNYLDEFCSLFDENKETMHAFVDEYNVDALNQVHRLQENQSRIDALQQYINSNYTHPATPSDRETKTKLKKQLAGLEDTKIEIYNDYFDAVIDTISEAVIHHQYDPNHKGSFIPLYWTCRRTSKQSKIHFHSGINRSPPRPPVRWTGALYRILL